MIAVVEKICLKFFQVSYGGHLGFLKRADVKKRRHDLQKDRRPADYIIMNEMTATFIYLFMGLKSFSTTKVISRLGKWGKGPEPLVE